jgi:aryl-phospho-beta-D-glucosidase BglC (GH1 family)
MTGERRLVRNPLREELQPDSDASANASQQPDAACSGCVRQGRRRATIVASAAVLAIVFAATIASVRPVRIASNGNAQSPPPDWTRPERMVQRMGIGINLGNTLEAPFEGDWAPRATETDFDQYQERGFRNVRIPVRWHNHTGLDPPYQIDQSFLSHVVEVVNSSLDRGMVTTVRVTSSTNA